MKNLLLGLLLFCSLQILGQGNVESKLMSWWNISGNYSLSEKVGISALYSWRRADFIASGQQSLVRVGLDYQVVDGMKSTVGYDWVVTFPNEGNSLDHNVTEHRIYERLTLLQDIAKVKIVHRYQFEQRFFDNTDLVKHRLRYRLGFSIPITRNKKLLLESSDELFINYGEGSHGHIFDQNWIYGGVAYKVNKNVALKLGGMMQSISKGGNSSVIQYHLLQFGLALRK